MYKDSQTTYMHASSTDEHSRLVYAPLLFDVLPLGDADLVDGKHLFLCRRPSPCAQHANSDGVCSIAFARTPVSWDGGASHSNTPLNTLSLCRRRRSAKGPLVKAGRSRWSIQLRRLSADRRWPQFSAEADSALVQLCSRHRVDGRAIVVCEPQPRWLLDTKRE